MMEVLTLRSQSGGYRGCVIDADHYLFFLLSRKNRLRRLKRYPKSDFMGPDHFLAIMLKNITPATIFRPPVPIASLTMEELDRIHAENLKHTTLDPIPV